ncbi:MAG: glycosyltransferase [Chitinophagaceae bacterium]|nr:MAG: glycosyltransferase [Chitinophagaceae bacterium]
MVTVVGFCAIYIILYSAFVLKLYLGLGRLPEIFLTDAKPAIGFSLIIPLRNEAQNLPRLLESIAALDYPRELFEVIFIDDASGDDSPAIINRWRMQHGLVTTTLIENIQITASPKKNAILRAMPIARFDWVITTDADCSLPQNWLRAFNGYIEKSNVEMVAAPVVFTRVRGLLASFQRLDFLSLQAVTLGSFGIDRPFMCNGANLAYTKKLFREAGGFQGNEAIASGDDVFLLQRVASLCPEKLGYLKSRDAIVETLPEKTIGRLLNQRVRWAAKANSYENDYADELAGITFLSNLFLLASCILAGCGFVPMLWAVVLFGYKLIIDWLFLAKADKFLKNFQIVFPVFAAIVHPVFIVGVALYAAFGKYAWKGRKFRV